ncbi:MAG: hypothetical protein JNL74_02150 [Fibrobacteres bacterium]|nr:hypothetical protein [Fibrobacterota bacterium]
MDSMTIFNFCSGIASIISLIIAISAKNEVKRINRNQEITMRQSGIGNKQSGRDMHG